MQGLPVPATGHPVEGSISKALLRRAYLPGIPPRPRRSPPLGHSHAGDPTPRTYGSGSKRPSHPTQLRRHDGLGPRARNIFGHVSPTSPHFKPLLTHLPSLRKIPNITRGVRFATLEKFKTEEQAARCLRACLALGLAKYVDADAKTEKYEEPARK